MLPTGIYFASGKKSPPGIINIQYYLPIFTDRGTPLKYPHCKHP